MDRISFKLCGVGMLMMAVVSVLLFGSLACAQAPDTPPVTVESVNAKADAAALAGNNAWMLTRKMCSAS